MGLRSNVKDLRVGNSLLCKYAHSVCYTKYSLYPIVEVSDSHIIVVDDEGDRVTMSYGFTLENFVPVEQHPILMRFKSWADSRRISEQAPDRNGFVANITEELGEYLEATKQKDFDETIDAICDIVTFSLTELTKYDVSIPRALDEVLKVIESRVGQWDDVNNKFQKDVSPEAKANWYTPNYQSCVDNA